MSNADDPLADDGWTLEEFERAAIAANDAARREEPNRTFYTRCTDTQFLVVGVFAVVEAAERITYFMWESDGWYLIDEAKFTYYRDDVDTNFAESSEAELALVAPWVSAFDSAQVPDEDDEVINFTKTDMVDQAGRASAIAAIMHRGVTDKLGYPYIDHPARVASAFDRIFEPVEHCAAWLHDVLEDTELTAQDLVDAGIWPVVAEVVQLLTRSVEISNEDYYERIRVNPFARAVKLADIADNLAPWRVRQLDQETRTRLAKKYQKALIALDAGGSE